MIRKFHKTIIDVIDLPDIRNRMDNSYYVKLEALEEPIKLDNREKINLRVYFTIPRKEGEDSSSRRINFISDIAALLLADMVRAKKCFIGRW
jgi:hypothetical protein